MTETIQRTMSKASGLDITALVLAIFFPLIGVILGIVGVVEAHKQNRRAHGLSVAAIIVGSVEVLLIVIVVAVVVAAASKSGTQQFIDCTQGQVNGTVPLSVDCSQFGN